MSDREEDSRNIFLDKLEPVDRKNVEDVLEVLLKVGHSYFTPHFNPIIMRDISEASSNLEQFTRQRNENEEIEEGYPFLVAYATGGYVTKEGDRPDIDLVVASNFWWSSGYLDDTEAPIAYELDEYLGDIFNIEIEGVLPSGYDLGVTEGKGMLRLTPRDGVGKPIDLLIVRGIVDRDATCLEDEDKYKFLSVTEFEERDVDPETADPLPRVKLLLVA